MQNRKKHTHRKVRDKEEGRRRRNEGLSCHSLRHTAVTLLKEAGIPQAVVMELVGHDNEEMSQHLHSRRPYRLGRCGKSIS